MTISKEAQQALGGDLLGGTLEAGNAFDHLNPPDQISKKVVRGEKPGTYDTDNEERMVFNRMRPQANGDSKKAWELAIAFLDKKYAQDYKYWMRQVDSFIDGEGADELPRFYERMKNVGAPPELVKRLQAEMMQEETTKIDGGKAISPETWRLHYSENEPG